MPWPACATGSTDAAVLVRDVLVGTGKVCLKGGTNEAASSPLAVLFGAIKAARVDGEVGATTRGGVEAAPGNGVFPLDDGVTRLDAVDEAEEERRLRLGAGEPAGLGSRDVESREERRF